MLLAGASVAVAGTSMGVTGNRAYATAGPAAHNVGDR